MAKETKSRTQSEVLEQGRLRAFQRANDDFNNLFLSDDFYEDLERRAIDDGYDPDYVRSEVERYKANEAKYESKEAYRRLIVNAMFWLYQEEFTE